MADNRPFVDYDRFVTAQDIDRATSAIRHEIEQLRNSLIFIAQTNDRIWLECKNRDPSKTNEEIFEMAKATLFQTQMRAILLALHMTKHDVYDTKAAIQWIQESYV